MYNPIWILIPFDPADTDQTDPVQRIDPTTNTTQTYSNTLSILLN